MNDRIHQFEASILRQYDIRGTWGENLNQNDAILLAQKLTSILIAKKNTQKKSENCKNYCALVARDGRHSSEALSKALIEGFQKSAIKAIDLGLVPTPALYFAEKYLRENINAIGAEINEILCAVMITGSHNPPQQNGFKIVASGKPFFGRDIQELAQKTNAEISDSEPKIKLEKQLKPTSLDIADPYLARLLLEDKRVKGGKIQAVWDAGGGATATILKPLLARLAGEHSLLFGEIDPSFKARSPDPSKPRALNSLQNALAKKEGAKVGLAFDGDGDRLVVMLKDGRCITGDKLTLVFAQELIKQDSIKQELIKQELIKQDLVKKDSLKKQAQSISEKSAPLILCDIKTSPNIIKRINELGGIAKLVPSGHANIKHAIRKQGAAMAGEVSGHLFFNDRYYGYDDAIYAAVRLCALLRGGLAIEKTLAALPDSVSSSELRLQVIEEEKFALVEKLRQKLEQRRSTNNTDKQVDKTTDEQAGKKVDKRTGGYNVRSLCTLDGVRVEYEHGWWLLRASNTEATIVLCAEANDATACRAILKFVASLLAECGFANPQQVANAELIHS